MVPGGGRYPLTVSEDHEAAGVTTNNSRIGRQDLEIAAIEETVTCIFFILNRIGRPACLGKNVSQVIRIESFNAKAILKRFFPLENGKTVTPSGRLPSSRSIPGLGIVPRPTSLPFKDVIRSQMPQITASSLKARK